LVLIGHLVELDDGHRLCRMAKEHSG
jgi:hypothetical protein